MQSLDFSAYRLVLRSRGLHCGFCGTEVNTINASEASSHASILDQGIRETDRNFLNELARENNQDDHGDGKPLPAPDRNTVKAWAIAESLKTVPRADSVEDTGYERHKAKVVHGEIPSSSVRPKLARKSLAGGEYFRRIRRREVSIQQSDKSEAKQQQKEARMRSERKDAHRPLIGGDTS